MSDILIRVRFLVVLLICTTSIGLQGQSFKAFNKAGDKAFAEKDYQAAMYYFSEALAFKPKEPGISFKYAESARQAKALESARDYYLVVLKSKKTALIPNATFGLGDVYQQLGNYSEAIEQFEAYQNMSNITPESKRLAIQKIENCKWATTILEQAQPYDIKQLNKRINTAYSEFGTYVSGDTLYYSSFRFDNEEDTNVPPRKISKVLYSLKGAKGRTMRRSFNLASKHTAHTTFSLDKNRIYFTICDYINASDIRCAIYYKEKDRRRRWKKTPVKLPKAINLDSFTSTQPAIAYDSILQSEVLYFVSNRPGGVGDLDIWVAKVGEGDNNFERPINLKEINTTGNDATPFYHNISQTLYFSSDGHQGLGGFDLFKVKNKDGLWREPIEHLGYPLNSSYNDVYPFIKEDEQSGYFSSNREGSFYLDRDNKSCCNDIFYFEWVEPEKEVVETDSLVIVEIETTPDPEPKVEEKPKQPEKLEDFLPLALYFDNDEPDKRTRRTTTKKAYGDTFEKYYDRRGEYRREYAKPLEEEDRASAELVISDFFEDKVRLGHDHLFLFSEILLKRLQEGEEVEIFIKGFTSPRAKSDYNLALSQRRISSLRNHFDRYQDGVFLPYLDTKKLKVTEQPFGETTADTSISDEIEDQRNSIYSVGAASERRVEIVEIKRGNN